MRQSIDDVKFFEKLIVVLHKNENELITKKKGKPTQSNIIIAQIFEIEY